MFVCEFVLDVSVPVSFGVCQVLVRRRSSMASVARELPRRLDISCVCAPQVIVAPAMVALLALFVPGALVEHCGLCCVRVVLVRCMCSALVQGCCCWLMYRGGPALVS